MKEYFRGTCFIYYFDRDGFRVHEGRTKIVTEYGSAKTTVWGGERHNLAEDPGKIHRTHDGISMWVIDRNDELVKETFLQFEHEDLYRQIDQMNNNQKRINELIQNIKVLGGKEEA